MKLNRISNQQLPNVNEEADPHLELPLARCNPRVWLINQSHCHYQKKKKNLRESSGHVIAPWEEAAASGSLHQNPHMGLQS